ncbi:MAG: cupin domain-containing protein [Candidatus Aminicenantes bacterium]
MIVKNDDDVREEYLDQEDIKDVLKKVLIGPEDGSDNMVMRYFKVLPHGYTYHHSHDFEHVVRVEKGKGIVVNESGEETVVSEGQSLFIGPNEKHQFKNPFQSVFEFLCIILNQEKQS